MAPRFESVREDPAAARGGIVQHPLQCQDSTKLRKVSEISRMVAILELYSTIVGKYAETCPEGGGGNLLYRFQRGAGFLLGIGLHTFIISVK